MIRNKQSTILHSVLMEINSTKGWKELEIKNIFLPAFRPVHLKLVLYIKLKLLLIGVSYI